MRWLHRGLIALGTAGLVALVLRSGLAALARDASTLGAGVSLVVAVAVLEPARGLLFSLVLRLQQLAFGGVGLLLYARGLAGLACPAGSRPAC